MGNLMHGCMQNKQETRRIRGQGATGHCGFLAQKGDLGMKRAPLQWLSLTCAAAALAVGCAARTPAPRPAPVTPIGQAGLIPNTAGYTTGDADACAVALGNAGGAGEVTANGILIGNVALVGLPTVDSLPITPPGGVPAAPGAPAGPRPAPAGSLAESQNTRAAPNPAAPLAPRGQRFADGGAFDRTGTPGAVGRGGTAERTPPRTGGTVPAPVPGVAVLPVPGAATAPAGPNLEAVERIRRSCPAVAEIRVVTDAADRARLAEIAMAVRKGQPVTRYMEAIGRISRGASASAGRTR
jgi:hypothetical protein